MLTDYELSADPKRTPTIFDRFGFKESEPNRRIVTIQQVTPVKSFTNKKGTNSTVFSVKFVFDEPLLDENGQKRPENTRRLYGEYTIFLGRDEAGFFAQYDALKRYSGFSGITIAFSGLYKDGSYTNTKTGDWVDAMSVKQFSILGDKIALDDLIDQARAIVRKELIEQGVALPSEIGTHGPATSAIDDSDQNW